MHGYLRDLQRPAGKGVSAGGGDRGGRRLLRWRDAGEPPERAGGHEDVPDHRGERGAVTAKRQKSHGKNQ